MRKPCCVGKHTNIGAWTIQEDEKLVEYIHIHGEGSWRNLPKAAGLQRCGKSCKARWLNYLSPDVRKHNFGQDEEDLIIKLHALLGNRWPLIAGRLPGRTDNEVKNYWNSHITRKLISMGIDPNNHRLNQHFPNGNHRCGADCKLSGIIIDAPKVATACVNDEQLSDSASCFDDLKTAELNLDLTIALPALGEEKGENTNQCNMSKDAEKLSHPPSIYKI